MSNFQLQDITLFNDSFDLSLKGSWINFQTQMQKTVIHRVLSFHVETVVLLSKGIIDSQKVKVEMSLADMDMSRFKKGATYEAIKDYVKEQTGYKVSSLYIAQVKAKHGLDMRENFNLPKSEDARLPKCPAEKEKAIEDALRHFQMI